MFHWQQMFSSLPLTDAEYSVALLPGGEGGVHVCGLSKPGGWGGNSAGNWMGSVLQVHRAAQRCGVADCPLGERKSPWKSFVPTSPPTSSVHCAFHTQEADSKFPKLLHGTLGLWRAGNEKQVGSGWDGRGSYGHFLPTGSKRLMGQTWPKSRLSLIPTLSWPLSGPGHSGPILLPCCWFFHLLSASVPGVFHTCAPSPLSNPRSLDALPLASSWPKAESWPELSGQVW